ncbi:hypothetical protein KKH13_02605 [Patescibacteria group bacterium]|nr:hypothetical protein [Patescibacteria group bacterium]
MKKALFYWAERQDMVMPAEAPLPTGATSPGEPMSSLIPKGAAIPDHPIPAETQVSQDELDKAAVERGKLIEAFG